MVSKDAVSGNTSSAKVTLERTKDDWNVLVGGDYIGHVYRERQRSDRYPYGESQVPLALAGQQDRRRGLHDTTRRCH